MKTLNYLNKGLNLFLILWLVVEPALAYGPQSTIWQVRQKFIADGANEITLPQQRLIAHDSPNPNHENRTRNDEESMVALVPASAGSVRKIDKPKTPSKGIVVHIQDVHLHKEAQRHIGDIVGSFINRGIVQLVGLEGAFNAIDLSSFHNPIFAQSKKNVADYFLLSGRISGPIHCLLTNSNRSISVLGIDDEITYQKNVAAYRIASKKQPFVKKLLDEKYSKLIRERDRLANTALKKFDASTSAFYSGSMPLGSYVKVLLQSSPSAPPILRSFSSAIDQEHVLNESLIATQRTALLGKLLPLLSQAQAAEFVRRSVAFRSGRMSHAGFYRVVRDLCITQQIDLRRYPHLDRYINYVLAAESLNGDEVFAAITDLEQSVAESLALTSEEKKLMDELRRCRFEQKLVRFSLNPVEWKKLRHFNAQRATPSSLNPNNDLSNELKMFRRFYELAEIRDQLMADNLIKAMSSSVSNSSSSINSILVTGGFHSEGITRRLSMAGFTVMTIVPHMTSIDTASGPAALSLFAQQKSPLDQLFENKTLFLSPPPSRPNSELALSIAAEQERHHPGSFSQTLDLQSKNLSAQVKINQIQRMASGLKCWVSIFKKNIVVSVKSSKGFRIDQLTIELVASATAFSALSSLYFRLGLGWSLPLSLIGGLAGGLMVILLVFDHIDKDPWPGLLASVSENTTAFLNFPSIRRGQSLGKINSDSPPNNSSFSDTSLPKHWKPNWPRPTSDEIGRATQCISRLSIGVGDKKYIDMYEFFTESQLSGKSFQEKARTFSALFFTDADLASRSLIYHIQSKHEYLARMFYNPQAHSDEHETAWNLPIDLIAAIIDHGIQFNERPKETDPLGAFRCGISRMVCELPLEAALYLINQFSEPTQRAIVLDFADIAIEEFAASREARKFVVLILPKIPAKLLSQAWAHGSEKIQQYFSKLGISPEISASHSSGNPHKSWSKPNAHELAKARLVQQRLQDHHLDPSHLIESPEMGNTAFERARSFRTLALIDADLAGMLLLSFHNSQEEWKFLWQPQQSGLEQAIEDGLIAEVFEHAITTFRAINQHTIRARLANNLSPLYTIELLCFLTDHQLRLLAQRLSADNAAVFVSAIYAKKNSANFVRKFGPNGRSRLEHFVQLIPEHTLRLATPLVSAEMLQALSKSGLIEPSLDDEIYSFDINGPMPRHWHPQWPIPSTQDIAQAKELETHLLSGKITAQNFLNENNLKQSGQILRALYYIHPNLVGMLLLTIDSHHEAWATLWGQKIGVIPKSMAADMLNRALLVESKIKTRRLSALLPGDKPWRPRESQIRRPRIVLELMNYSTEALNTTLMGIMTEETLALFLEILSREITSLSKKYGTEIANKLSTAFGLISVQRLEKAAHLSAPHTLDALSHLGFSKKSRKLGALNEPSQDKQIPHWNSSWSKPSQQHLNETQNILNQMMEQGIKPTFKKFSDQTMNLPENLMALFYLQPLVASGVLLSVEKDDELTIAQVLETLPTDLTTKLIDTAWELETNQNSILWGSYSFRPKFNFHNLVLSFGMVYDTDIIVQILSALSQPSRAQLTSLIEKTLLEPHLSKNSRQQLKQIIESLRKKRPSLSELRSMGLTSAVPRVLEPRAGMVGQATGKLIILRDLHPTREMLRKLPHYAIVVAEWLPSAYLDVGPFRAIFTHRDEGELNHAYTRARAWNVPSGFWPSPEYKNLADLENQVVHVNVTRSGIDFRLATEQEKAEFIKSSKENPLVRKAELPEPNRKAFNRPLTPKDKEITDPASVTHKVAFTQQLRELNLAVNEEPDIKVKVEPGIVLPPHFFLTLINKLNAQDIYNHYVKQAENPNLPASYRWDKKFSSWLKTSAHIASIIKNLLIEYGLEPLIKQGVFIRLCTNAEDNPWVPGMGSGVHPTFPHIRDVETAARLIQQGWAQIFDEPAFLNRHLYNADERRVIPVIWMVLSQQADYAFMMNTSDVDRMDPDHIPVNVVQGLGLSLGAGTDQDSRWVGTPTHIIWRRTLLPNGNLEPSGHPLDSHIAVSQMSTKLYKAVLSKSPTGDIDVEQTHDDLEFTHQKNWQRVIHALAIVADRIEKHFAPSGYPYRQIEGIIQKQPDGKWMIVLLQAPPLNNPFSIEHKETSALGWGTLLLGVMATLTLGITTDISAITLSVIYLSSMIFHEAGHLAQIGLQHKPPLVFDRKGIHIVGADGWSGIAASSSLAITGLVLMGHLPSYASLWVTLLVVNTIFALSKADWKQSSEFISPILQRWMEWLFPSKRTHRLAKELVNLILSTHSSNPSHIKYGLEQFFAQSPILLGIEEWSHETKKTPRNWTDEWKEIARSDEFIDALKIQAQQAQHNLTINEVRPLIEDLIGETINQREIEELKQNIFIHISSADDLAWAEKIAQKATKAASITLLTDSIEDENYISKKASQWSLPKPINEVKFHRGLFNGKSMVLWRLWPLIGHTSPADCVVICRQSVVIDDSMLDEFSPLYSVKLLTVSDILSGFMRTVKELQLIDRLSKALVVARQA